MNGKGGEISSALGAFANKDRKFLQFEEIRKFVHSLEFNNIEQWKEYCKSGNKPEYIPSLPSRTYKKEWKGVGRFPWHWKYIAHRTFKPDFYRLKKLEIMHKN